VDYIPVYCRQSYCSSWLFEIKSSENSSKKNTKYNLSSIIPEKFQVKDRILLVHEQVIYNQTCGKSGTDFWLLQTM
jgi:hypothetical protein